MGILLGVDGQPPCLASFDSKAQLVGEAHQALILACATFNKFHFYQDNLVYTHSGTRCSWACYRLVGNLRLL